jgi:Na+/H+ antiporter NhaA
MSLFVANLAFGNGQVLEISKIAVILASVVSAVLGCVLLVRHVGVVAMREESVTL